MEYIVFESDCHMVVQIDPLFVRLSKKKGNRQQTIERSAIPFTFREERKEVDMYLAQMFNEQYKTKAIKWESEGL